MRVFLTILMFVLPLSAAKADELAAHCERAGQLYYRNDGLVAANVESFPDLDVPRVRLDLKDQREIEATTTDWLTDWDGILCTFTRDGSQYALKEFCSPTGCLGVDPLRVEEVKVLLEREGY